jgi:hypothetical protein
VLTQTQLASATHEINGVGNGTADLAALVPGLLSAIESAQFGVVKVVGNA